MRQEAAPWSSPLPDKSPCLGGSVEERRGCDKPRRKVPPADLSPFPQETTENPLPVRAGLNDGVGQTLYALMEYRYRYPCGKTMGSILTILPLPASGRVSTISCPRRSISYHTYPQELYGTGSHCLSRTAPAKFTQVRDTPPSEPLRTKPVLSMNPVFSVELEMTLKAGVEAEVPDPGSTTGRPCT